MSKPELRGRTWPN